MIDPTDVRVHFTAICRRTAAVASALILMLASGACLDWDALSTAVDDARAERAPDTGGAADQGPANSCVVYCCDGHVWTGQVLDRDACHSESQVLCATRGNVLKHFFAGTQTYQKDARCWGKCDCHSAYSDMSKVDLDSDGKPDYPSLTSAQCKPSVEAWCKRQGCGHSADQWTYCDPT